MATRRSQKSVEEDPNVIFRIGVNRKFTSSKQSFSTTFECPDGKGNTATLAAGWRIITRNFDTAENIKKACRVASFHPTVSRSKPYIIIRKSDNVDGATINMLVDHFRKMPFMLDKNDKDQWDPHMEEAIGSQASAEWFFEDMRQARVQKMSTNEDTIEIGAILHKMKGDDKALRDALFIIGETPEKEDTTDELYFMLSNAIITDPKTKTRKLFMKYFVNPEATDSEIDILKWFNKGVACSVIDVRAGFFVFGSTRFGVSEGECIEFLGFNDEIFRSLKVSISNATGIKEDIEVANKVVKASGGNEDVARAIIYVQDKMKENGLSSRPDMIMRKVDTLEGAVAKYNEKVKANELPMSDRITAKGVLLEIGAVEA